MSNSLNTHWYATKRMLKYLARTIDFDLEFKPSIKLSINGFGDADWDSCLDARKSPSDI